MGGQFRLLKIRRVRPGRTVNFRCERAIISMNNKAIQFFRESYEELRRVTWLGRKEVVASTIVVIILVLIVALYVFCIDFVLSRVISYIL